MNTTIPIYHLKDARGIMVLDASALVALSFPFGDNQADMHAGTFLKMLGCLKEHGFKIYVPEAVVCELNIHPLLDTDRYFELEAHNSRQYLRQVKNRIMRTWMKDMHVPVIDAVQSMDRADGYRYYCHAFHKLVEFQKLNGKNIGAMNTKICDFQRIQHADYGEAHAMDVIGEYMQQRGKDAPPIFWLSEDKESRRDMRESLSYQHRKHVGLLSVMGMVNAFAGERSANGQSLMRLLELPEDGVQVHGIIEKHCQALGYHKVPEHEYTRAELTHQYNDLLYDRCANGKQGFFAKHIEGMAEAIAVRQPAHVDQEERPRMSSERLAALQKRFPNFKPSQGQTR